MLVFIAYHDETSKAMSNELVSLWATESLKFRPVRLGSSPYFENQMFEYILQSYEDWKNEDYVGIVSYSILKKLESFSRGRFSINWQEVINKASGNKLDVVGVYMVEYLKDNKPISMIEGSTFQHGLHFSQAWEMLLQSCMYSYEQIFDPSITPFFCNWWISSPMQMLEYIKFFNQVLEKIINDSNLAAKLESNAYYKGELSQQSLSEIFGKPYYTLIPFIFERLPSFFFHHKKVRVGGLCKCKISL